MAREADLKKHFADVKRRIDSKQIVTEAHLETLVHGEDQLLSLLNYTDRSCETQMPLVRWGTVTYKVDYALACGTQGWLLDVKRPGISLAQHEPQMRDYLAHAADDKIKRRFGVLYNGEAARVVLPELRGKRPAASLEFRGHDQLAFLFSKLSQSGKKLGTALNAIRRRHELITAADKKRARDIEHTVQRIRMADAVVIRSLAEALGQERSVVREALAKFRLDA